MKTGDTFELILRYSKDPSSIDNIANFEEMILSVIDKPITLAFYNDNYKIIYTVLNGVERPYNSQCQPILVNNLVEVVAEKLEDPSIIKKYVLPNDINKFEEEIGTLKNALSFNI